MTVVTAYIHIYAYIQHICVVGNFSVHMNKILVEYLKTVSIQIFGFKLDYIQEYSTCYKLRKNLQLFTGI
jgi:hypothetical protein